MYPAFSVLLGSPKKSNPLDSIPSSRAESKLQRGFHRRSNHCRWSHHMLRENRAKSSPIWAGQFWNLPNLSLWCSIWCCVWYWTRHLCHNRLQRFFWLVCCLRAWLTRFRPQPPTLKSIFARTIGGVLKWIGIGRCRLPRAGVRPYGLERCFASRGRFGRNRIGICGIVRGRIFGGRSRRRGFWIPSM